MVYQTELFNGGYMQQSYSKYQGPTRRYKFQSVTDYTFPSSGPFQASTYSLNHGPDHPYWSTSGDYFENGAANEHHPFPTAALIKPMYRSPHHQGYASSYPYGNSMGHDIPHHQGYENSYPHENSKVHGSPHHQGYENSYPHGNSKGHGNPHHQGYDNSYPHGNSKVHGSPHHQGYENPHSQGHESPQHQNYGSPHSQDNESSHYQGHRSPRGQGHGSTNDLGHESLHHQSSGTDNSLGLGKTHGFGGAISNRINKLTQGYKYCGSDNPNNGHSPSVFIHGNPQSKDHENPHNQSHGNPHNQSHVGPHGLEKTHSFGGTATNNINKPTFGHNNYDNGSTNYGHIPSGFNNGYQQPSWTLKGLDDDDDE